MVYIAAKKRAIPHEIRRIVARRAGATGVGRFDAYCHWCGNHGRVNWMSPAWVHFTDLELDHVVPEVRGGQATEDNIVLACRRCNRRFGFRPRRLP